MYGSRPVRRATNTIQIIRSSSDKMFYFFLPLQDLWREADTTPILVTNLKTHDKPTAYKKIKEFRQQCDRLAKHLAEQDERFATLDRLFRGMGLSLIDRDTVQTESEMINSVTQDLAYQQIGTETSAHSLQYRRLDLFKYHRLREQGETDFDGNICIDYTVLTLHSKYAREFLQLYGISMEDYQTGIFNSIESTLNFRANAQAQLGVALQLGCTRQLCIELLDIIAEADRCIREARWRSRTEPERSCQQEAVQMSPCSLRRSPGTRKKDVWWRRRPREI